MALANFSHDQLQERTSLIFSASKLKQLKDSTVLLAGVGGVGGAAFEVLVRLGVGRIILVDGDVVQPSNLNRQLITDATCIGQSKVLVALERAKRINPYVEVIAHHQMLHQESIEPLLSGYNIDLILDAIDSVGSKAQLIAYAVEREIPVVTALGAAQRSDPRCLTVMNIFKTHSDPLARSLRSALRKMHISKPVLAIFSTEEPIKSGLEVAKQQGVKFLGSYVAVVLVAGSLLAHTGIDLLLSLDNK